MEITTIQKYIHTTPRKLRLAADLVRDRKPIQALEILQFTNKAAALPLSKAIKTALANAKMQNLDAEALVFKKLEVNEGPKMKRFRAGAKGRAKRYIKKMSQIKVVLGENNGTKN